MARTAVAHLTEYRRNTWLVGGAYAWNTKNGIDRNTFTTP